MSVCEKARRECCDPGDKALSCSAKPINTPPTPKITTCIHSLHTPQWTPLFATTNHLYVQKKGWAAFVDRRQPTPGKSTAIGSGFGGFSRRFRRFLAVFAPQLGNNPVHVVKNDRLAL